MSTNLPGPVDVQVQQDDYQVIEYSEQTLLVEDEHVQHCKQGSGMAVLSSIIKIILFLLLV